MPDTNAAASTPKPVDHELTLVVVNRKVIAKPLVSLQRGQTVRYVCADGEVRIDFPGGSPYAVRTVIGSAPQTIVNTGDFVGHCFVTLEGETVPIGWSERDPDAGSPHGVENPPPPPG